MKKLMAVFTFLSAAAAAQAATGDNIAVISREAGSGTRGAFVEILGIEKNIDGKKKDMTTKEAVIANKTDVTMTFVAGDPNAIGYISLGSLNDTVKAVKIDGAAPSVENILNDTYKIARPFNIAVSPKADPAASDFVNFILSAEGQAVISKNYIPVSDAPKSFESSKPKGRISVAGSSSVTPVMERLKEEYNKINPSLKIEIQQSDSSTGMAAAINGLCDIGMASRNLKEKELKTLEPVAIAIDGIAVIVNGANEITSLTKEEVADIFEGRRTRW